MKSYSDRTQAKKGSQNGKNLPIKQDFVKSWRNGQNLSKMESIQIVAAIFHFLT